MAAMNARMSPESKRLLLVGVLIAVALFLFAVREILMVFIFAVLVVYVLLPLVDRIERLTRLPRGIVIGLIYVLLIGLLIGPVAIALPRLVRQALAIQLDFEAIAERASELAAQRGPILVGGVEISLNAVYDQVQGSLQAIVSFLTARTADLLLGVISSVGLLILVLVIAFYLLKETPKFSQLVLSLTTPAYHAEVRRMLAEVHGVFGTFLRGQLLLMLSIFVITAIVLTIVGLRNALPLALAAALLELVPIVGPILAAIPAIAIALFQDPTPFGLNNLTYALLIAGVYFVIQQVENHLLVPNIIGRAINLHPAAVIFAVLAGATIGGLLGVFLAAPVAASLRIIGRFVKALLLDQPPPVAPAAIEPIPASAPRVALPAEPHSESAQPPERVRS